MNYRTYRTFVLAVLLLTSMAVPASLAVQPQMAQAARADATSFLHPRASTEPPRTQSPCPPIPPAPKGWLTHVALIAANNKYVAAEGGGGRELVANRSALGPWESFNVVHLGDERLALQASNGKYVSAAGGGGGVVLANADCVGPWETFQMKRPGNSRIALQTANGHFLCAEGGGGRELVANRTQAGPWESFYMIAW
jgi:hypothetical protein